MSDVQYKVAKTVREAASLMLAAKGKGYDPGRRYRPSGADEVGHARRPA